MFGDVSIGNAGKTDPTDTVNPSLNVLGTISTAQLIFREQNNTANGKIATASLQLLSQAQTPIPTPVLSSHTRRDARQSSPGVQLRRHL